MTEQQLATLAKLNRKYDGSSVTALFAAGKFDEAAIMAGKFGMWGLFEACRTNKEIPYEDARTALLIEIEAGKKAHYSKP